jgi:hypothetical protein
MLGGNDYGRRHWVAEPKLDFNTPNGSTTALRCVTARAAQRERDPFRELLAP